VLAALLTEGAEATPGAGLGALSVSVPMATGLNGGVVLRIAPHLPGPVRHTERHARRPAPGDPRPVHGAIRHGDPDLAALERRAEDIFSRV